MPILEFRSAIQMKMLRVVIALLVGLSCAGLSSHAQVSTGISEIRFLDEYVVPHNLMFMGTRIGGLSGIDYDAANNQFYMISDDRSAINAARFYKAAIRLTNEGKIDTVTFTSVHELLQENGKPYPSAKTDPHLTPDPESIRYNPKTGQLVWSSEGDKVVLQHPSVNVSSIDGRYAAAFSLPSNLSMQHGEKGPRANGTLEGLTFNEDFTIIFASMEEALFDDGPRTNTTETSWTRVTVLDAATRRPVAQYPYRIEPLAHAPFPSGAFAINGVTEILYLGNGQLLFVERSFSTGRLACTVKVFLGDLNIVDNVLDVPSLTDQPPHNAIHKKLMLNMDSLGIFIDNIEGVTFGPALPNGNKTLIFVSDNNFQAIQKTQLLLFEVIMD